MRDKTRNVLKIVKIEKNKLLEVVRENREKHIQDYKDSVEGYHKDIKIKAAEYHKAAKSEKWEVFSSWQAPTFPSKPTSYEAEYNRAIRMLELTSDDILEIEEQVFNQLVLDEWQWKPHFTASSTYFKNVK